MESIAKGMQILIEKVLIVRGECPECGGNLYGYRAKIKMVRNDVRLRV